MSEKNRVGAPSVAAHVPGIIIPDPLTAMHQRQRHDLRVRELAWVMEVTEYSARKLCETGAVPAWRPVDAAGNSERLRWNAPVATLMPLLKTAAARRRLERLILGQVNIPRRGRLDDQPTPAGSLDSSDTGSVTEPDCRSDTIISHVWTLSDMMSSDTLSGGAR